MNSNYSAQEKNFATALLHNLWKYLLLAASIVATVKIIFFGFDIDEQYAVSMAYRLVQGDRMFLEMWEPHQTSAFFSAAFLWLYMQLFHTLKYSVLFLRIVGVVLRILLLSLLFFTTISFPRTVPFPIFPICFCGSVCFCFSASCTFFLRRTMRYLENISVLL